MSPASRCFLCAVSILLAGLGCGGKDKLVRLEGIVTLDGEPVEGAIVSFLPDEAGGRFASGTTAKDGSFRLTTNRPDDGALPGDYRVTVTLIPADEDEEDKGPEAAPVKEKAEDGKQMMAAMVKIAAARQKALERSPIPAIYRDGGRTPLRQIVPAKGKVVLALKREQPPVKTMQNVESTAQPAEPVPLRQQQPAIP